MFQSLDWPTRLAYVSDKAASSLDEDFLRKALDLTDSARIETGSDTEISLKRNLAVHLVRLLAALPAPASAPAIARLPFQYRDPMVRGESWLALAKLGDRSVISSLVRILSGLNESGQRGRSEEIQASYAVQALGALKAAEGFRAVAQASLAWYTPASGVRALAKSTLSVLVPDPDAAVLQILATDDDLVLREGLFLAIADRGDATLTAQASSAVLGTLVRLIPRDKEDQDRTFRLTLAALTKAQKSPTPPATLVPSLKVLLQRKGNSQEVIESIHLLGRINDPAALSLLVETLTQYNEQQKSHANSAQDLTYVKELFLALAQTGKAAARGPLNDARLSDYTPALLRDAADAAAKLPNE